MEIKIDIPESEIIDALIGALEGGSNYWYNFSDVTMVEQLKGGSMSESIIKSALNGKTIPVNDVEDYTFLGNISKENIERGLTLYSKERGIIKADEMDANDSDVLFQYIVMGEIVYG